MSNPPVEPSTPDGPESGKPAPQYGQNAPQYGQQSPQYGEQTPKYGEQTPQYGQQSPQYGEQTPQYGQNAQYGQQPPTYGQQAPQYGQNAQFGQGASGPSPYAQYPGSQQGPVAAPKLVNIAFWFIVASGILWLLTLLFSIGTLDAPAVRDMFQQQMRASGANVNFSEIKPVLVGTIVVFAVISAALYAVVALNVRKGRNWARIMGTVFAALSLFSLFPLSVGTLAVLAGIAGIVMLYLPAAAPYFRKQQSFGNPYAQNPYGR